MALGFSVDVVATRNPGDASYEDIEGVRTYRVPIAHAVGGGFRRALFEYLGFTLLSAGLVASLMIRRRYTIVQIHNPPDFLAVVALIPRLLGARSILDVHDFSVDMFEMRFGTRRGAGALRRILLAIEALAVRSADAVITVHEPYRRGLARTGRPIADIDVVMNSLDERLLPPPRQDDHTDATCRIVYHGTITPPYGVSMLVDALPAVLDAVANARLEIFGGGDSVVDVRARALKLGVERHVMITGRHCGQRDVLRAVQGAKVGVVPNLPVALNRYALSSKLFEYICLRIPVVCARLPTLAEYFDESELRFFEPGNSDALAAAIIETVSEPIATAARVQAAERRYAAYRWAVSARRYGQVLERLSGSAAREGEAR